MSVQRMTHLGICVADLERARAFYTQALDCEELGGIRTTGPTVDALLGLSNVDCDAIYLQRDGFRLELLCYRSPAHVGEARPRPMNRLGFTHLSIRVSDLDEVCRRIEAFGGTILRESEGAHPERGTRFLMATDPDGTRIELIQAPGDPAQIPQFPKRDERHAPRRRVASRHPILR